MSYRIISNNNSNIIVTRHSTFMKFLSSLPCHEVKALEYLEKVCYVLIEEMLYLLILKPPRFLA